MLRMKLLLLFLFCAVIFVNTNGAKILVVFQMPAYSHYSLGNKIVKVLAEKGHDVTYVASYNDEKLPKSVRQIVLTGFHEQGEESKKKFFGPNTPGFLAAIPMFINFGTNITTEVLTHPNFRPLWTDPKESFDLIIIEEFLNQPLKALGHVFKAPVIAFSTVGPSSWINRIVQNPAPVSYVPNMMVSFGSRMNFWQRLTNAAMCWLDEAIDHFVLKPKMDALIDEFFPGAPHVDGLNENVALIFMNSHVSTNQPVPLLPNMIEIGGYHVDPPKKLPEDLQKYLDSAKNGVILFSLGSNMKSIYLPEEIKQALIKSFAKFDINVLWKYEDDELPGKPDNVKISKWLPQQDILAHPNIKLFITHGGLLSTIETIYHGKPIIALPVGGDQKLNAATAVNEGYALQLDTFKFTEEEMTWALNEMLNNPKYAANAKRRSKLMHDRIVTPRETLAYWVDYVLRHKGAKHYRSAAKDLAWYELYMLDVLAFVVLAIYITFFVTRAIFRRICCGKSKKSNSSTKTKSKRE